MATIEASSDVISTAIEAVQLSRSFADFVREATPIVYGVNYVHGRHIDVITNHMTGVSHGEIKRLLVNVPPSTNKSALTSVLFPAWVWTWNRSASFAYYSYSEKLALRDASLCRELIKSSWYQRYWPEVQLVRGEAEKGFYRIEGGGWRFSSSVGSLATGLHPSMAIVIDDAQSRDQVDSKVNRDWVKEWYFGTMSTRGIGHDVAHVISQQRLHVDDLSGHVIEFMKQLDRENEENPWYHVMLPMRFDSTNTMRNLGYGADWRTEEGELLYPEKLSERIVRGVERALGSYGKASQLQQKPVVRDGQVFQVSKLKFISKDELPRNMTRWYRGWDRANTEDGGCFTAGVLIGEQRIQYGSGNEAIVEYRYYIVHVYRKQIDGNSVEMEIKKHCLLDEEVRGFGKLRTFVEEEPGSSGPKVAQDTVRRLRGHRVYSVKASKSKEERAELLAKAIEYGEVYVLLDDWTAEYVAELEKFPGGKYADQVDATVVAFNEFVAPSVKITGSAAVADQTSKGLPLTSGADIPKCKSEGCKRPAWENEYCCPCCEEASLRGLANQDVSHLPICNGRFTDWFAKQR